MAPAPGRSDVPAARPSRIVGALLAIFFLSGALALAYQVAWIRALTLEFGATTPALATAVSLFLGGLGLGAWLAGRRADSFTRALTGYGLLETGISAWALASPLLIVYVLPLFALAAAASGLELAAVPAARFLAALVLLGPPTVLMGATLPVLARFWVRRIGEGGRGAGVLYAINTLGAFAGAFATGLVLLPALGLHGTLLAAGGTNLAMAGLALALGRRWDPGEPIAQEEAAPRPRKGRKGKSAPQPHLEAAVAPLAAAVAFAACASLICQVIWTRVLELALGPSVYVATIIVGTFVGALGLGALAAAAVLRRRPGLVRYGFAATAMLSAVAIYATTWSFGRLPDLFRRLYLAWELEENAHAVLGGQMLLAALVMVPPTFLMGALLPAALRQQIRRSEQTARVTGRLYGWDTVGSIVGALAAGFLLLPLVGVVASLFLASCLLAVAAVLSLPRLRPGGRFSFAAAAVALLFALGTTLPPWQQQVMASGMHHYASYYADLGGMTLAERLERDYDLLYYADGMHGTVTVTRGRHGARPQTYLSINGKFEGTSRHDMPTQRLVAHLPFVFHPEARKVGVIGMGTGATAAAAARHPGVEVEVAEIEARVIDAAELHFAPYNDRLHERDNVAILKTDGRLFVKMNPGAFDVIVSQPSNPWFGASPALFTREYYRMGAEGLRPGGVFAQWLQLYSMSPDNVRVLMRTFTDVFPYTYVFSTLAEIDLVLVGSREPIRLDMARMEGLFAEPVLRRDLAEIGVLSPVDLLARFRMGPDSLRAYAGDGGRHTDSRPIIAYRAPLDLYLDTGPWNKREMAPHVDAVVGQVVGLPEDEASRAPLLARIRRACVDYIGRPDLCDRLTAPVAPSPRPSP